MPLKGVVGSSSCYSPWAVCCPARLRLPVRGVAFRRGGVHLVGSCPAALFQLLIWLHRSNPRRHVLPTAEPSVVMGLCSGTITTGALPPAIRRSPGVRQSPRTHTSLGQAPSTLTARSPSSLTNEAHGVPHVRQRAVRDCVLEQFAQIAPSAPQTASLAPTRPR